MLNSTYSYQRIHHKEYSQEFHYYPFSVKLDRYVGSCNNLNDLSNKVYVPNKIENSNLRVFNKITSINDSKTIKSIFDANVNVNLMKKNIIEINDGITISVKFDCKKNYAYENDHV